MRIRKETAADYKAVYALVEAAFQTAEHADGDEQDLVERLRKSATFIPELSLVAEDDGIVVGYILFTKNKIGDSEQLTLAPLAVLPERQREGIGGKLIMEGHRIAENLGYGYSIVLGHASYYPRFGYVPAKEYGIRAPFQVPDEHFMACKLMQAAEEIEGVLQYPPEFGI